MYMYILCCICVYVLGNSHQKWIDVNTMVCCVSKFCLLHVQYVCPISVNFNIVCTLNCCVGYISVALVVSIICNNYFMKSPILLFPVILMGPPLYNSNHFNLVTRWPVCSTLYAVVIHIQHQTMYTYSYNHLYY